MEAIANTEQKTILCIDDCKEMLSALRRVLHPLHYRVLLANQPQHGLELAALMQPDLIFLDVKMPEMDGFSVLRELRAQQNADVPVVMVTATQDFVSGYQAGCTCFLTKPCRANYVRDLVRYLIGNLTPIERCRLAQQL